MKVNDDLKLRVRKIKGQVVGIEKMIEEERSCGEVVQQLVAAKSALQRVATRLLREELKSSCKSSEEIEKLLDNFLEAK